MEFPRQGRPRTAVEKLASVLALGITGAVMECNLQKPAGVGITIGIRMGVIIILISVTVLITTNQENQSDAADPGRHSRLGDANSSLATPKPAASQAKTLPLHFTSGARSTRFWLLENPVQHDMFHWLVWRGRPKSPEFGTPFPHSRILLHPTNKTATVLCNH